MLRQRIVTAAILGVVVIGSILFDDTGLLALLFALALAFAARELVALILPGKPAVAIVIALAFALLFWWSAERIDQQLVYWQSLAGASAWILIMFALPLYRHHGNWPLLPRVILLGVGLDLLWICVHGLLYLQRQFDPGQWILLYLLTLVWVADIGAYFSGRRFGKTRLAPAISPGKTREGVAGGLLANLCWMLIVYFLVDGWQIDLPLFVAIGIATVAISVVGDLSISVLKREAGVKDSGRLLPGHGGMLDRIDSIIAAAPVFVSGLFLAGVT
ncbi:MAG: phosphatidate cytidylyltransferase [Gammaproteobacteria bacterium]|nr:phosphatidate cytidylyltransferase [Gammaproteobacteria bacterium]